MNFLTSLILSDVILTKYTPLFKFFILISVFVELVSVDNKTLTLTSIMETVAFVFKPFPMILSSAGFGYKSKDNPLECSTLNTHTL